MSDEATLRASCEKDPEARAALERLLARLAAAEKVCKLIRISLSPKLRAAHGKKIQWWDAGAAVKDWEAHVPASELLQRDHS